MSGSDFITDKSIIKNNGVVGGDYFALQNLNISKHKLDYYINQFNPNYYWIYKYTKIQRQVSVEEFLRFDNAGYVFFKKDAYDKNKIDVWIDWMVQLGGIQFLTKPLPPFHPNKIIIRK